MTAALPQPNTPDVAPPRARPGIQPGQNAGEGQARVLEGDLRTAARRVLVDPQVQAAVPSGYKLDLVPGVSRTELHSLMAARGLKDLPSASQLAGYTPDGGIFRLVDAQGHAEHVLASEAKHQQNAGNAIERWHKNHALSTMVAPKLASVVFADGAGADEGGVIRKCLYPAFMQQAFSEADPTGQLPPLRKFNVAYPTGPSFFARSQGFSTEEMTQELKAVLLPLLSSRAKS
jgi:hypothetical protein